MCSYSAPRGPCERQYSLLSAPSTVSPTPTSGVPPRSATASHRPPNSRILTSIQKWSAGWVSLRSFISVMVAKARTDRSPSPPPYPYPGSTESGTVRRDLSYSRCRCSVRVCASEMEGEVRSRSMSAQTRADRRILGPVGMCCAGRMAGPRVSRKCGSQGVGGTGKSSAMSVVMT